MENNHLEKCFSRVSHQGTQRPLQKGRTHLELKAEFGGGIRIVLVS